ncbi:MAG TPA: FtsX-like permease family protein [Gemmataceae bacterium]|nr:FtsX-like permease family protein [Gemmataceae bacterium]
MRAIDRKLVRDLWQMRGQAAAVGLVIACGAATFVMSLTTLDSLERTRDAYYDRYRFAEAFAHVKRAPNGLAGRLADVPGVSAVQTRVVVEVTLDVPGLTEPAVGRVTSLDPADGLNRLHLRSGRLPEPGRTGEVLVGEAFFSANKLNLGDSLKAVINGRRQNLRIVGTTLSPEYIYPIRPGEMLPDDRRFAVLWMGYDDLAAAFDMRGAFNDVALALTPGASEPDVLRRVDLLTDPYGAAGAHGRADQLSHMFITNEIEQLRATALVAPSIFLAVAAFLLNIAIARLVRLQREQIAMLKAFGYTHWQIGLHYFKLVGVIVLFGVTLGTIVGAWMGAGLTEMYSQFFRFPSNDYYFRPRVALLTLAICGVAAALGALSAVRAAVLLPPAEAMRPEPPPKYRPTLLERLGLNRFLPASARMILRQLERQPVKSLLSLAGMSMAIAVMILGSFSKDAIDLFIDLQFQQAQRETLTVAFAEPTRGRVVHDLEHLPGVRRVEPFRAVAARLSVGPRSRREAIQGLVSRPDLHRLLDADGTHVELPPDGLVLSEALADALEVRPGQTVTVEVLEGERPVREVLVVGLIRDYIGRSAYMNIDAVRRLLREGDTVSGAYVDAEPGHTDRLYKDLKAAPRVAGVTVKDAAIRSFEATIAENLLRIRMFNVIFASIISFGVVYNSARVALAERSRELATLRVLGFTRAEVARLLLGEMALLTAAAIPIGCVIGRILAEIAVAALSTETQRIPVAVFPGTYLLASGTVVVAATLSGLAVRRQVNRLDLVGVLKERE